jgi:hypothetical protein
VSPAGGLPDAHRSPEGLEAGPARKSLALLTIGGRMLSRADARSVLVFGATGRWLIRRTCHSAGGATG